jgi:hypothetical protein
MTLSVLVDRYVWCRVDWYVGVLWRSVGRYKATPMQAVEAYAKLADSFFFFFFFCGEGPRSWSYGRTAALRLIVQPCDEDEDEQFFTKLYK